MKSKQNISWGMEGQQVVESLKKMQTTVGLGGPKGGCIPTMRIGPEAQIHNTRP